jgi:hypothetical protein
MAFVKTLMSVLGFLRFIPSSRYHAKEGEVVIDLSSASVTARQVIEDAFSFFYLSESNLTREEKQFREDVWRFHGATESIESVRFANVSNPDLAPAIDAEVKRRKELLEKHPMLGAIEGGRRGRILQVARIAFYTIAKSLNGVVSRRKCMTQAVKYSRTLRTSRPFLIS